MRIDEIPKERSPIEAVGLKIEESIWGVNLGTMSVKRYWTMKM